MLKRPNPGSNAPRNALRDVLAALVLLSSVLSASGCVPSDPGDPNRRRVGVVLGSDGTYEVLVHLCDGESLLQVRAVPDEEPEIGEPIFWRGEPADHGSSGLLATDASVPSLEILTTGGTLVASELPDALAIEASIDGLGWLPIPVDGEEMVVDLVRVSAEAFDGEDFVSRSTFRDVNERACDPDE